MGNGHWWHCFINFKYKRISIKMEENNGYKPKTVRIDASSIDFQFGQLTTKIDSMKGSIDEIKNVIKGLPCLDHSNKIENLEQLDVNCKEQGLWKSRNTIKFKQALLCVAIGATLTGVGTVIGLAL